MKVDPLDGGGVRVRASAKINLYLEVLGIRPDRFHEIDTIMEEVSLHDEIEIRPLEGAAAGGPRLLIRGPDGGPSPLAPSADNLVLRAARLLAKASGLPAYRSAALEIVLTKRIPIGAGLGGGSSDAAGTLLGLSRFWGLAGGRESLHRLAAELGSDVAFFLRGGTARCRGRGEIIEPLPPDPPDAPRHYVLVSPGIEVSTSLIYSELDRVANWNPALTATSLLDTMSPESIWKALRKGDLFCNRLEPIACKAFPEIECCLNELRQEPFRAVLMSGSGSTVYGVCGSRGEAEEIAARLRKRLRNRFREMVFVVENEPAYPG
jgi:4-diphosphocytidyl-2-C-methyl-D-erythritol kinase